ncbi:MAG: HAD family hydrolase [Nitriliruptoraceae bacterium]
MADVTIGGRTFTVDAVLFDKDGTIVSHDPLWTVWSDMLTETLASALSLSVDQTRQLWQSPSVQRVDAQPLEVATMEMLRQRTTQLVQSLGFVPREARRMVRRAVDCADDAMDRVTPQFNSNVNVLLDACVTADVPLGLVTGDDRARARQHLHRLNITDAFSVVIGGDDTRHGKPSGMPLRAACTVLDVEPARTIYIGDSLVDLRAARDAGCQAAVLYADETRGLSRWMLDADLIVYDYSMITVAASPAYTTNGGSAKWNSVLV